MSRTTVLSPAASTIGQKVSLLTSVTCPTVTVGPAVSKLHLTLNLVLSLTLIVVKVRLAMFMLLALLDIQEEEEEEEEEEEPSDNNLAEDEAESRIIEGVASHLHLGEAQRFRAICDFAKQVPISNLRELN